MSIGKIAAIVFTKVAAGGRKVKVNVPALKMPKKYFKNAVQLRDLDAKKITTLKLDPKSLGEIPTRSVIKDFLSQTGSTEIALDELNKFYKLC